MTKPFNHAAISLLVLAPLAACAPGPALAPLSGHLPPGISALRPLGPLDGDAPIRLIIGLRAQHEAERTALLHDLYDPSSPQFRQYLTPEEYTARFAPTAEAYQQLVTFAQDNGLEIVATPADRAYLEVRATPAAIDRAFDITLERYRDPVDGRTFFAPDREPSVDPAFGITHITGLDDYRRPMRAPNQAPHAGGSGSGGRFTGRDFRAAYAPDVTLRGTGQTVGVLELDGYKPSDITAYTQANGLGIVTPQNVYLDGYTGGATNAESTADIELVASMAPAAHVVVYGTLYDEAGIIDALHEMANPTHGEARPNQISTSYYFWYDQNVYNGLAQLAAQGQALFVASGDYGAYNEKTGAGAFPPSDHPLVTAVGATVLDTTGPVGAWSAETTASFSGGGYSPWAGSDPQFALPWWQSGMSFATFGGSSSSRNGPDVAMVGTNISVLVNGAWSGFAGTSASSPLWAGYMALVNQQAAVEGRPRVGFLNPTLYAVARSGGCPSCFHDITTGNNFNAANPSSYSAVPGFDLCTGWGTPNGQTLIDALVDYGRGWGVLPGGGTTSTADAAAVFDDHLYLFAIGSGDHQHYVDAFDGHAWAGWHAIPGGGTTLLPDTAAAFQGRLYVFGIGIGDHRHYVSSFDGSSWSGWSAVPGGGTTSTPDAAVVFGDRLYLFAIGTDDHRHYVDSFDGWSWSGWHLVPGGGTTQLADTAAVLDGKLYLFGIGTGDHQHYVNTFDGASWSGWHVLPGGGTTALSDTATVRDGRLYLFAVGITDQHHYMNTFDGATWSGWAQVPGGGTTALPDAATTFQGKVYLFAVGANDHQHYMNVIP